jgi:hypothetical protein
MSAGGVAAWTDQHVIVVGSAGGRGAVAISSNSGSTWSTVTTTTPPLGSVGAFGDGFAWALAGCIDDPCTTPLFGTTDGGLSWAELPRPPEAFRAIAVADAQRGWAVPVQSGTAAFDTLYRTVDGAHTWVGSPAPCPEGWRLVAVAVAAPSDAWVGCVGGPGTIMQPRAIVATVDGGTLWHVIALNDPGTGERVGRIDASGHLTGMTALGNSLWAWANRGVLSHSLDGGRTWTDLPLGSPDVVEVGSAAFGSDSDGFALVWDADAAGVLFERSADGGQTWTVVASFAR